MAANVPMVNPVVAGGVANLRRFVNNGMLVNVSADTLFGVFGGFESLSG